jgi:hypothetical protein
LDISDSQLNEEKKKMINKSSRDSSRALQRMDNKPSDAEIVIGFILGGLATYYTGGYLLSFFPI